MNLKYATSEMGLEGRFNANHPYLRVFETQLLFLDLEHIPVFKLLQSNNSYQGDLLFNIGKGGFEKDYIRLLYTNFNNVVELLKNKFNKVYIYQDGEVGWWNQVDVKLQVWWYNQLASSDGIIVPNTSDIKFYKGMFPETPIKVIRSVMTDEGLDKSKFKPKSGRSIITGPLTREYNGLAQVLLAHNYGLPIDIPPMGESRMPKDSWEMADNIGVNYLSYMTWIDWMYNLNQYEIGYMMAAATASGSFALNCAYLGIPCIGCNKTDTQLLLFPELAVDSFDTQKALELTLKLKNDKEFYNKVSLYAKKMYEKEFSRNAMISLLQTTF